jgi:pimeloyl-ACP methyl ester carboxylesterase
MHIGLLCLLMLVSSGCAFPAYPVTLLPAECPLAIPEELEEGRTITCGYLQLPQDRNVPHGLQVKLPYAHIRAESAHPHPDPLVYIVGGPGGSALAEFGEIYHWFRSLRRDRDLILYDQRGTLLADPVLECAHENAPPTQAETNAASSRVPAYLHPVDANDVVVARCAQQLQAQGISLAHYDTATHALDLIDLMGALGYARYNLYGTSYGTRIALEVMRMAPPGLRAVVLDSVYPPTINAYEVHHALTTLEVLAHAFALCAEDAACNAAYPQLAARFDRAIKQLDAEPLVLPLEWQREFRGSDLLQLMLTRLDGALLPYLPRLIVEVERGESALLVQVLRGEVPPPAPPRPVPVSAADEARVSEFVLSLNGAFLVQQAQLDRAAMAEWQQLTARNADRNRLTSFIEKYLPAETSQMLLAQLAQLTDADLALVFAELRSIPLYPLTRGANLAVQCRDELPFNDYQTAIIAHQQVGIPDALVADELTRLRHDWVQCTLFPTGVAAPTQTEPVVSSLPTLIFQGGLDTITPPSWAEAARRTLPDAHYYEFPGQGHLVIQQPPSVSSGCPAQMARAFLDTPAQAPDASCIGENYRIEWSLPGQDLPE